MNININISNRTFILLSAIIVLVITSGAIIAFNQDWQEGDTNIADIHGHSPDEIQLGPLGFEPSNISDKGWGDESNGKVKFPNGLIMKWGKVNPPKTSSYEVDFTDEGLSDFSNACFQVFLTTAYSSSSVGSSHDRHTNTRELDKTGFTIEGDERLVNWPHRWFAIGR